MPLVILPEVELEMNRMASQFSRLINKVHAKVAFTSHRSQPPSYIKDYKGTLRGFISIFKFLGFTGVSNLSISPSYYNF